MESLGGAFRILRSRPHGHVAAVVGTACELGFERLPDRKASRHRSLAAAMALARILAPGSKLATARGLSGETLASTLGEELDVQDAGVGELYAAMDWLLGAAGGDRAATGAPASEGRLACAVRRDFGVFRGAALPAGEARLLARRQAGFVAGRLRAVVRGGRLSGAGRGVSRAARRTRIRARWAAS